VRLGSRIGGIFGPTGSKIGASAGEMFRAVTGFGDYKVSSNSLITSMDQLPSFKNLTAGTRVVHREYLFDVITSDTIGAFKNESIPIQPALLASFPWLSASAENYQEYRINGLIYEFKSNSYDALSSTNTASGTVVMATDYNVLDPPFANKFEMEQTQFTTSGKPSISLMHPIECNRVETPTNVLYTRAGAVTSGDARLYDWGNFQIATVGMQGASTNIGELWCTYDITLLKPKLLNTVDVYDHYVLPQGHFIPGGPVYFGSTNFPPTLVPESDMGTTLSDSGSGGLDTITWPPGYTGKVCVIYRSDIQSIPSSSLASTYGFDFPDSVLPWTTFGTGGGFPAGDNEGSGPLVYNANGGVTFLLFLRIVNGGYITLIGGTSSGPPRAGDLIIVALPQNFDESLNGTLRQLTTKKKTTPTETKTYEYLADIEDTYTHVRPHLSERLTTTTSSQTTSSQSFEVKPKSISNKSTSKAP